MKKFFATCMAVVMLVGTFAMFTACNDNGGGSGGTNGDNVTLRVWRAAADENRNRWWEETLDRFTDLHPHITIEFLGVPGNPADFMQRLDMAVAANDAPDIISTNIDPSFIARGLLEPLDPFLDSWVARDQIPDMFLAPFYALDFNHYPRRLFGLPHGGNVEVFYVRPDLIHAAGMSIPTTWDEFFDVAAATTDRAQGVFGYIIRGGGGGPTALLTQMFSYSGITDFFIDGVSTINHPLHVEFVERFFAGFGVYTSEDDITKGWPEMAAQFQSGNAAMLIHNLGSARANYEAFDNDTNTVLAIPYLYSMTGTRVLPTNQPSGNMIMASSQHTEEAWLLINWLAEVEQDSGFHELMSNLPINTETLQASWIQDVSFMRTGAEMMTSPNTQLVLVPSHLPNFTTIMNSFVGPNIQSVLLGRMTPQELLDDWAERLQADYDNLMGN